jgi:hypothetical protein
MQHPNHLWPRLLKYENFPSTMEKCKGVIKIGEGDYP